MTPRRTVITPDKTTQIQGIPSFMLKARTIRMMPEATRAAPRKSVNSAAASNGFWNVKTPATMYNIPRATHSRNLPQDLNWKALMTSATPAISIMMPTTKTLATVARATLESAISPART